MNEKAIARLDEWAQHSPQLAYIVECLKQVMTLEMADWIMKDGKSAQGLWEYITSQAQKQRQQGMPGVLITPPQMQEHIYAYLRLDKDAGENAEINKPTTTVEHDEEMPDTAAHPEQLGILDMLNEIEQPTFFEGG